MRNRWGILVIIVITGIFYLTFQTPTQTTQLSEGFRGWLANHGIVWDSSTVRSNAHLPEYFFTRGFSLSFCRMEKSIMERFPGWDY